jgi:hypothetical protein
VILVINEVHASKKINLKKSLNGIGNLVSNLKHFTYLNFFAMYI